jgi:hypothetical protein
VEAFVRIGLDAQRLEAHRSTDEPDEEEEELRNAKFVEPEENKRNKSRKRWYATQVKRLAICMADFI